VYVSKRARLERFQEIKFNVTTASLKHFAAVMAPGVEEENAENIAGHGTPLFRTIFVFFTRSKTLGGPVPNSSGTKREVKRTNRRERFTRSRF